MFISKLLLLASSLCLTATASKAKNATVPDIKKVSSGLLSPDFIRAATLFVNDDYINSGVSCASCRVRSTLPLT